MLKAPLKMTAAAATYRRRSDPAPVFSGPRDQGPDKSRGPDLQDQVLPPLHHG